jgi:PPOX class probable FMN-dependent enzyme
MEDLSDVTDLGVLRDLYGEPMHSALIKEVTHLTEPYAALIRASPFAVLATSGEGGLDASPRGGTPGFVRVVDKTTLILPDRSGNNRVDSLSNLVGDPRIALIFLIPGVSECMRVNGKARISVDPELLQSFMDGNGKLPRAAIIVTIDRCYAQCSQAIMRAKLWDADAQVDRKSLPTFGKMLQACQAEFDAGAFDRSYVGVPPED